MTLIKGFTTKGDVVQQLADAGATVVLPFTATNLEVEFNPFAAIAPEKIRSGDRKKQQHIRIKKAKNEK